MPFTNLFTILSIIRQACLSTPLPNAFGQLANLKTLVYSDLGPLFCGDIPRSSSLPEFNGLNSLEELNISIPGLVGSIGADFGSLTSLRHLYISAPKLPGQSSSYFGGVISKAFWNLHELVSVRLMHTSIGGIERDSHLTTPIVFPHLVEFMMTSSPSFCGDLSSILRGAPNLKIFQLYGVARPVFSTADLVTCSQLTRLVVLDTPAQIDLDDNFWNSLSSLEEIHLSSSSASGQIGAGIGYMTRLKTLILGDSRINGTIPSSIGLTALQKLDLKGTSISHPLPEALGRLGATLYHFAISNMVNGPGIIPESIGNLTNLHALWLRKCDLNGTIPRSLAHLSNLKYLYIDNNKLSGPLPDIEGEENIIAFSAHYNNLQGAIPPSLATRTMHLRLGNNDLSGLIPSYHFLNNTNLQTLSLPKNRFEGPLPQLPSFITLDLSYNRFDGSIPHWNTSQAATIRLSHNRLVGDLSSLSDACTSFSLRQQ